MISRTWHGVVPEEFGAESEHTKSPESLFFKAFRAFTVLKGQKYGANDGN